MQLLDSQNTSGNIDLASLIKDNIDESSDPALLCVHCQIIITHDKHRISINHSHEHKFSNPNDIIFHIGCFEIADGIALMSEKHEQWSWFSGYQWQIALCKSCGIHLGWCFSAIATGQFDRFYGLILGRLIEQK